MVTIQVDGKGLSIQAFISHTRVCTAKEIHKSFIYKANELKPIKLPH